jgi:hypothetical protein
MAAGRGGKGWSKVALGRGVEVLDALEEIAEPPAYAADLALGPLGGKQTSPNHEATLWSAEALRAAAFGTRAEWQRARDVILRAYLPREMPDLDLKPAPGVARIGLWAGEQMAPDNHTHQHLPGPTLSRLAAVLRGDRELLELTGVLLRRTANALCAVATPRHVNGHPYAGRLQMWSAGLRAKGRPVAYIGTLWLRTLVEGDPGVGSFDFLLDAKRAARNWRDPMHVCLRGLRILRGMMGRPPPLALAQRISPRGCAVKHPMAVHRWADGHLAVMPRSAALEGKREVCDWVLVRYGGDLEGQAKSVEWSNDWEKAPPRPPRGAETIEFPGNGGRAWSGGQTWSTVGAGAPSYGPGSRSCRSWRTS